MARRFLAPGEPDPLLVATYAWERVRLDPVPGPRPPSGFSNLGRVGDRHTEVLAQSETIPPGRSTLPRLQHNTGARLFVLDADHGATGMRSQIEQLIETLVVARVVVVDVGGDAVADGTEPALLSPLADALVLAACIDLPVPTDLAVIGPGVDGELPAQLVVQYLEGLSAARLGALGAQDCDTLRGVFDWHPTEASALVAAAALGVRGSVELRRGSIRTQLTDRSREVWLTKTRSVVRHNRLVSPLAATTSLHAAEEVVGQWVTSELSRERVRALTFQGPGAYEPVDKAQLLADVVMYSRQECMRGVDLITVRRLAEASGHAGQDTSHISECLATMCPSARRGPLWDVQTLAQMQI
jgi:hypothetical protein